MRNQAEQSDLPRNIKRKLILHFSVGKGKLELLSPVPEQ
jgi:hypothetical protein